MPNRGWSGEFNIHSICAKPQALQFKLAMKWHGCDWITMQTVTDRLQGVGVVPVVALDSAEQAMPLAEALEAGGLACLEITYRSEAATEAIRRVAATGRFLLGAGTVTKVSQVHEAADAGAQFIVSPGVSPAILEACRELGLAALPGTCTPTEIMAAVSHGCEVVKFFPAEAYGGLATIKALAGPFPGVRFMPTGGISRDNLADYLNFSKVVACGGSWMVKPDWIRSGQWGEITREAGETVAMVKVIRGL